MNNGKSLGSRSSSFPLFCRVMTSVKPLPGEPQNLKGASSCGTCSVLYSNVCSLRQAFGELCKTIDIIYNIYGKTCLSYHPLFVCLTETHLSDDPADSVCPPGYVIPARCDRTRHRGGVLILARDYLTRFTLRPLLNPVLRS